MNSSKLFIRLLALWLVACVLIVAYAWLNVVMIATPSWVDVTFGVVLILGLMRWTAQPAIGLAKRRMGRLVGWAFATLAALTGMLWVSPSPVTDCMNRFPLSILYSPTQLIAVITVRPILQIRQAYHTGVELPLATMLQLALGGSVLGLVALVTTVALRIVWISLQPVLSPRLDALCARLPRLPIRPGRWLARLRRLLLAGLVLSFVVSGLAAVANARIPQSDWRAMTIGPDVPPPVLALVLDERDGTLYACTKDGVFRSTDGGARWQAVSAGLTTSSVLSLVLDGRDGTLYAGIDDGEVFRSADGGASWQAVSNGLINIAVSALVLDERDGTLYAGTDGDGIFRSADGGANWQAVNTGLVNTSVSALVLDKQDGTLYAGADGSGVVRSTDGGANWRAVSNGLTDTNVLALVLDERDGTLYAGTDGDGIFRSANEGANWQSTSTGLVNTSVSALVLDERDGTLYAGTHGGVFRSTDGGASWQAVSDGLTNIDVLALMLDERDGTLYACTMAGVFRSSNGGAGWQAASDGLIHILVSALVLDEQDGTLYAGTRGGVFHSTNGGATWQATTNAGLFDATVWSLVLDERDGTLYAAYPFGGGGVFRSIDGGTSWQAANNGLTSTNVWALVLDKRNDILYAGTLEGGVSRSADGGANWQATGSALADTSVLALVLDERDGTLYAGAADSGVFRSTDGGANWQAVSNELTETEVLALVLNERDGTLYAGTSEGVFRSSDSGVSWQPSSNGLTEINVWALVLDKQDGTLYAADALGGGGVFRSTDGGVRWEATSNGLTNTNVWALVLDARDGTLYAGTLGGGVFRSTDGGASWQAASNGLTNTNMWALALDERDSILYAGTRVGGVFRSDDSGTNWQAASNGLTDTAVRALALDTQNGTLYADTKDGMFLSTDGGGRWQITSTYPLLDLLSIRQGYGVVGRGPEGSPVWAAYGGGAFWARLAARLDLHQATIQPQPDGKAQILAAWGPTLSRAELESGYRRISLAWLALRAWAWKATIWTTDNSRWLVAALALAITLALSFTYANLARPFGLPLWATLLARRRLDAYARPAALEAAWPDWEQAVRTELLRYGDATADDLLRVPGPFRRYALRRYAQTYDSIQTLESHPGRLRLLTGDRLHRWHAAWATAARSLGTRAGVTVAGRTAIDDLAAVLANALGLTLDQPRDFEAARACLVEAPVLRLKLPPRFPLVFIADPQPDARTVQMLVDAVDVLRETGYFALVVPLEPRVRQLDVAAELRQAVDRSPHVQDFIVLSQDDVLDILLARHPAQSLVQCILAQMDLTVVSPFLVSGPVPETMFFGRETEVKTLVESAGSTDFAIIGNRKIGKTSLLQRTRARMAAGKRVRPLMVDCQTVRDATGFFAAFQAQTDLVLSAPTPEGLTAALTELRQDGLPVVLLMDEVDALLTDEKARGEPLVATWRALSQADVCHFVFCSSTGLARRLDDPDSVLFNFPQPLPLGYLSPETARMVLIQPLVTLGIVIEDTETLQAKVLALTSGHPNLIQYLGRGLVEAANRRGERCILLDDLTVLRNSTDFVEYYLKTVWGQAGPLEKLITLIASPNGFRLGELEAALIAHGVQVREEELDTALKLLRIYAILEKHERTYTFVPRAFPEILHRTQEVERLIAIEKRRLMA